MRESLHGTSGAPTLPGMVWLALVTWVVVLLLVLPAAGVMLPSLGALVLVTLAGTGTTVVFAVTGADAWAWISFAMACVAALLATVGARTLIYDEAQTLQGVRDGVKSTGALCLGLGVPILLVAVPITLGTAAA